MSMDDDVTRLPVDEGEHVGLLRVGQVFGSYRVLRLLGRGGMGEVYAVRHGVLGTEHALKLIKREISSQPDAKKRFQDEARAMARLAHPGIVHVDDFGETEGLTWLRMEWVRGWRAHGALTTSLAEFLDGKGPLPEGQVRGITGAILEALVYAHGEGLVHRDLKPTNILLHGDGTVKISDFGLVRLVGEQWLQSQVRESVARSLSMSDRETVGPSGGSGSGGTSSKALLGTYAYMSPEQKEGREADHRSDLYAVGLMAFQMLTGENTVGLEMPSEICPELDTGWDGWVKRALAGNTARRFATAEEMLTAMPLEQPDSSGKDLGLSLTPFEYGAERENTQRVGNRNGAGSKEKSGRESAASNPPEYRRKEKKELSLKAFRKHLIANVDYAWKWRSWKEIEKKYREYLSDSNPDGPTMEREMLSEKRRVRTLNPMIKDKMRKDLTFEEFEEMLFSSDVAWKFRSHKERIDAYEHEMRCLNETQ
jgi:serine/threonine protein kinase